MGADIATPIPDRDALLALADEIESAVRFSRNSGNGDIACLYVERWANEIRAVATPSPQADKARGEVVAWTVFDAKGIRFTLYNRELASAIAERGLLVLPMFGCYEWLDAKADTWKPISRLPYTWERELGIQWRERSTAPQPQGDASLQRDRESDRRRFSDPAFNCWLDDGISDAGHTVWDAVGDVAAAWAGWEARQFAGDAVLIAECCGREECGGECGNEWLGMGLYRKPAEEAHPASADVTRLVDSWRERERLDESEVQWMRQKTYEQCANELEDALAPFTTDQQEAGHE